MNKKIKIRAAKREDLPQILELIKELALYEKAPNAVTNTVDDMLKDGFGEDKLYDAFVAEEHDTIVGTAITYYRYSTWNGKCLYLEDIVVSEQHRGKGAGHKLFQHCIDFGTDNGCKMMVWQVLDWNDSALEFYKKRGATLDGEWINGILAL